MKVPSWLKKRSVIDGVPNAIKDFSEKCKIQSFEEISIDLLKKYYQTNDRKVFFKLVRLLGFYGVIFYNKLKVFGGPLDDDPKVIFVPEDKRSDGIVNVDINTNIKTPLSSCGIVSLKYLHGVPIACFNKLIGTDPNNSEDFLFSPLRIMPASEIVYDFSGLNNFIKNKFKLFRPEDATSNEIQIIDGVPKFNGGGLNDNYLLEHLCFSVRTMRCLGKSNILSLGQLIKITEIELLSIPGFGKNSLNEVKMKLATFGLQLGTISSSKMEFCSIDYLNLSKRPRNSLLKAGIKNINQLMTKNSREIYLLRGMGDTSFNEINKKLDEYLSTAVDGEDKLLAANILHGHKKNKLNLSDEKNLNNLKTSISDIVMTQRSRNGLKNAKVEYIWQILSYTEKKLLNIKNFGRKSLKEISEIISNMSLNFGYKFSSEEIDLIMAYEKTFDQQLLNLWFQERVNEIKEHVFAFLPEKERVIACKRIFEVKVSKSTLEEIAKNFGMTRERIRQLESKALRKLRLQYQPELREVISAMISKIEESGGILNLDELGIDINFVSSKDREIVNQLIGLETSKIFIDWKCSLITSKGLKYLEKLCSEIQNEIFEIHKDELFTISMLANAVKIICDKNYIFTNGKYSNLTKKFLTKNKVSREGNYLSIGKMKKIEKIALAFKDLYPKGLKVYKNQDVLLSKIKEYDPIMFQGATQRSIIARLTAHSNVLLWGRGFFVHDSNISYDLTTVNEVIGWIITHFNKGYYRFQVGMPFSKYKEELIHSGVPNEYALYSLIRKQEIDRIGQRKFPTIVDLEADVNPEEGILEELEAFFQDQGCEVPYAKVKSEFVMKKGWKEYSVQQNICTHSELIYPWKNNSYIHLDFLDIDDSKLNNLIDKIKERLFLINAPYNLKGAKNDMKLLWEQACPYATTRTITKLIRQAGHDDLSVERNFIMFVNTPYESISTVGALEELFIEKNTKISRHELKEEFLESRGWTDNQFYTAIRNANLFQMGKNSFVHPSTINWNEILSQKVHEILTDFLKERNDNSWPHMQIEELIYAYVLPELPNDIEWTKSLVVSIGSEYDDFLFFDDAYVFVDNSFDIEDLDDIIAFLLAKEFSYGIAKSKEIEELLWREGILYSGHKIPKNQFFEGSSIAFLELNDEICLSDIGKLRYGKLR